MTPIAQQALARARSKLNGPTETTQEAGSSGSRRAIAPGATTIAGIPVRTERVLPAGVAFLVAAPNPTAQQAVKLVQDTGHTPAGPADHYMFLQGRKYALELAASLHAIERSIICENLRRSAAGKPANYALGIQSVIDLIEANQ